MKELTLGYSPCPNDTFIFYALSEGAVTLPFRVRTVLADVEKLNRHLKEGMLDISKISAHAVLDMLDRYWLLRSGGAIGRGCGPLVAAKGALSVEDLRDATIAIPGRLTTANLLLRLHGVHRGTAVPMQFDRIIPAIALGEVDAGVIIHEGRFTYQDYGLRMVLDLGKWWEEWTGFPLPLGVIAIRRELGPETARMVDEKIRESILYSRAHPDRVWPYIRRHAQEMEPDVIRRHIDMFVNDFSIDAGTEGETALERLLRAACELEGAALPAKPLFWSYTGF